MAGSVASGLSSDESFSIKFAVLGDTMTGKTSIISRFITDRVSIHYTPTTTCQIHFKTLKFSETKSCKIELWDVPGCLLHCIGVFNVLAHCDAILLVYDVTQPSTLKKLESWLELIDKVFPDPTLLDESTRTRAKIEMHLNENAQRTISYGKVVVKKYNPQRRHPVVAALGNKADLVHHRMVTPVMHHHFLERNDVFGYMVSAKQAESVFTAFLGTLNEVLGQVQETNEVKGLAKRLSVAQLAPVPTSIKHKREVPNFCHVQ